MSFLRKRRVALDIGTGMVKMAVADLKTDSASEKLVLSFIPLKPADAQAAVPLGADLAKSGSQKVSIKKKQIYIVCVLILTDKSV